MGTMGLASLIVSGVTMLMICFSVSAKCSAVSKEIGEAEKMLKSLEGELAREQNHWDSLKTTEGLATALARFGLEMNLAQETQLVRMNGKGVPVPGQMSLARLSRASGASAVKVAVRPVSAPSARTAVRHGRKR